MLVSVIIPVYNASKKIESCLESVINQTYKHLEIIVVNDGSTDKTYSIISKYSDSRIKVLNKINGGVSSARNFGLLNATGDYLAFVDSDDYIAPTYIEKFIKRADDKSLDIVICDYYQVDNFGEKKYIQNLDLDSNLIIDSNEYLNKLLLEQKISGAVWNKFIRAEIFKNHSVVFPNNISLGEDLYVSALVGKYATRIGKLSEPLYYYVDNPNSITRFNAMGKLYQVQLICALLTFNFPNFNLNKLVRGHFFAYILEIPYFDLFTSKYNKEIINYLIVLNKANFIFCRILLLKTYIFLLKIRKDYFCINKNN